MFFVDIFSLITNYQLFLFSQACVKQVTNNLKCDPQFYRYRNNIGLFVFMSPLLDMTNKAEGWEIILQKNVG